MRAYSEVVGRRGAARHARPGDLRRRATWPADQVWIPDGAQDQHAPGSWTQARGVRRSDHGLARWYDVEEVMVPFGTGGAGFLAYTEAGQEPMWISQGSAGWHRHDGTQALVLTGGYPTSLPDTLTSVTFNGFVVINDPSRAPYYYANGAAGDTVSAIPGWPGAAPVHDWLAGSVRGFREFLLAINLTESAVALGDRLRWSDQAPSGAMPSTWSPAPDNLAGFIDLTGTTGDLVDGRALGPDAFGLYKDGATYTLDYIGAPYVFRARNLSKVSGALGRNTIAEAPQGHVLWNGTDVVLNDGHTIRSLVGGRLRQWIGRTLQEQRTSLIYAFTNRQRREVWFMVPLEVFVADAWAAWGAFEVLAWDWERDAWSIRELPAPAVNLAAGYVPPPGARPASWDLDTEAWEDDPTPWQRIDPVSDNAVCYVNNRDSLSPVYRVDSALGGDLGQPLAATSGTRLVRESWDLGEPHRDKQVTGVRLAWNVERARFGVPDTQVRLGVQDNLVDAIRWSPAYTVSESTDGDVRVDVPGTDDVRGRYVSVELTTTLAQPWTFQGLEVEYRVGGRYVPPRASK